MWAVLTERTRWREFSKFVSNHVFSNVYGQKRFAVVYTKVETDKVWSDRGATGPGLDGFAVAGCLSLLNFFPETGINKEAFS